RRVEAAAELTAWWSSFQDTELRADLPECVESELKLVACVRRGNDRANACLPLRDGREPDPLREHPFVEQPIGERHRQCAITDDHRRNRTLAEPRIKTERLQTAL